MNYRLILERELLYRKERNSSYSLRAFARDIGMSPSKLSETFNHKVGISQRKAEEICEKLRFSLEESKYFVSLVNSEHAKDKRVKSEAKKYVSNHLISSEYSQVDLEKFKVIADWYHFAILELTEIKGFVFSKTNIAKALNISKEKTLNALQRLKKLNLLTRIKKNHYVQSNLHLATPSDIPSREIKMHHTQVLKKAIDSLENCPVKFREFSSSTMAIDSSKIEEAKKEIVNFRRKFCRDGQKSEDRDHVYCLSIQFFPLTNIDSDKKGV